MKDIKQQFSDVIEYSQDFVPNLDELFDRWAEAKKDIIDNLFGGKLIYECGKFSFPIDENEKDKKIRSFLELVVNVYRNEDLGNFIELNRDGFYTNSVECDMPFAHMGVKKGMKLVRAFKYFEKDTVALAQLQDAASRIIQENKVEGTLCFSVHPLDYLSVSVNTYNWRSCHALDGEYRAGNLSYMVDKSTIVCYIRGEDNVILPGFSPCVPWNSKKWRVLLYLNPTKNVIFAGKPYPFDSKAGLKALVPYIEQIMPSNGDFYPWHGWVSPVVNEVKDLITEEYYGTYEDYIYINGEIKLVSEVIKDNSKLHFNDVLRSSVYKPRYMFRTFMDWFKRAEYQPPEVGGEVKCLHCGHDLIAKSDMMLCTECSYEIYGYDEEYYYCDFCGASSLDDEDFFWVGDERVCPNCFERECFVCSECGDYEFNEYKKYDKETQHMICERCYNNKYEEEK